MIMLLALAFSIALAIVNVYNRLVSLKQNLNNGLAQIDVQLKRRHDLILNLVETVKGYAKHESETLTNVIAARNQAIKATTVEDKQQAEGNLTACLRQLFANVEAYPNLKADVLFIDLQDEITSTENRISIARQSYNDQVAVFNTSIQMFPSNVVAGNLGFSAGDYLQIDACDKDVPQVKF
jgi:LemA protein